MTLNDIFEGEDAGCLLHYFGCEFLQISLF